MILSNQDDRLHDGDYEQKDHPRLNNIVMDVGTVFKPRTDLEKLK
jgi:hypothetical protein